MDKRPHLVVGKGPVGAATLASHHVHPEVDLSLGPRASQMANVQWSELFILPIGKNFQFVLSLAHDRGWNMALSMVVKIVHQETLLQCVNALLIVAALTYTSVEVLQVQNHVEKIAGLILCQFVPSRRNHLCVVQFPMILRFVER
mmetsp:Transcript_98728/g.249176  ORF Transcript_98728/g.249176 Transcript_98728/m.249176 type:complete len:145 (+) Transcript_98728:545-979(+)